MKVYVTHLYRITYALIVLLAIGIQFSLYKDSFINFFSLFTVLSNLLVAIAFSLSVLKGINKQYSDFVRGAATVYILITAIGFLFLLGEKVADCSLG